MTQFVIHQHHARRLHWDLRLERDGVLVCWAVPRGLPRDPARNHLAVHTDDHPVEFLTFDGEIAAGQYGAGRMPIYDKGTYETEKWRDDEVMIVLHGERVSGRYVLFQTSGRDWMIHRMDPPPADWTPMPSDLVPATAAPSSRLPRDDDAWAYELDWRGNRVLASVAGGRLDLSTGDARAFRGLADALAPIECLLDGVVARLGDLDALLVFDVLWLDGQVVTGVPYVERRELLDALDIAGPLWQVPPYFSGGGRYALDTAKEQGLPGVVAKRLDSAYGDGWRRVKGGAPH